jgi:hypothetical protein
MVAAIVIGLSTGGAGWNPSPIFSRSWPATVSQVRHETRIQNRQIEVRRSEDTLQPN